MGSRLWIFLVGLGCSLILKGQTPSYLHYGVREGLPSNLVYCGLEDSSGLLWFGTDKGLARFDGQRFYVYTRAHGLPDPEVLDLHNGRNGRIWLSCFRKQVAYFQGGVFVTSQHDSLLGKIDAEFGIVGLYQDTGRTSWLTTNREKVYQISDRGVRSYPVRGVTVISRIGSSLLGFKANSIVDLDPAGGYAVVGDLSPWVTTKARYQGVAIVGNRVMFSYYDRVILLEKRGNSFVLIDWHKQPGGRVFSDREGRFWVCSPQGVYCFNATTSDLSRSVKYLPETNVNFGFEDRQGTIWFCTHGGGVIGLPRFAPISYSRADSLPSSNVTALALSLPGQVLAGDDRGNIHTFTRAGLQRTIRLGGEDGENRVLQITPQADGSYWATTNEGLFFQAPGPTPPLAIAGTQNFKCIKIRPDKIWYARGTSLGYLDYDFKNFTLVERRFTTLTADSETTIWAGDMNGLFAESDNFATNWGNYFPLLKSRIVALQAAGPGRLWVVTPESGLLRVAVQAGRVLEVAIVNDEPAHPIENIQNLFIDARNWLWMGTNRGIYGRKPNGKTVRFDSHDGVVDDDVSALVVSGDTLWAGTAAGLTRLRLNPPQANLAFSTLISGMHYQLADSAVFIDLIGRPAGPARVVLPPQATLLELELAGLDYRSRGNIRFECAITEALPPGQWWTLGNLASWISNGFQSKTDTSWIDHATLSFGVQLPPGRYDLHITAWSNREVRSLQAAEFSLIMRPHWYHSLWFMLMAWGLGVLVLWRAWRARSAYRELHAAVSELQLQALQAQINPHFIGNSINAIQQFFYPPDPVRASEYIELFTRLLRRTMVISERSIISFQEELDYDRDYMRMIRLRFGDRFQYEITGQEEIPPDLAFPSMVLQPILENATIHGLAPGGISILQLDFTWDGARLVCTVTDNGPGFRETLARKKINGSQRESKGLDLLSHKVATLNKYAGGQLELRLIDLAETGTDRQGTQAIFSFWPGKLRV